MMLPLLRTISLRNKTSMEVVWLVSWVLFPSLKMSHRAFWNIWSKIVLRTNWSKSLKVQEECTTTATVKALQVKWSTKVEWILAQNLRSMSIEEFHSHRWNKLSIVLITCSRDCQLIQKLQWVSNFSTFRERKLKACKSCKYIVVCW